MDLFTQIKMAVSVKEAAEYYGLEVNRGSMICCPFHADRTPSMKLNEDYFYCFGCGASGDVIDLAARLFGLSGYDAAKKLAADLGIVEQKPSVLTKLKRSKSQAELGSRSFRLLGDYLQILQDWKAHCAPQSPEDAIDPRYAEACHMLERIENMLDILTCGTPKERAEVVTDFQKDNRLALMEARNRQIRGTKMERNEPPPLDAGQALQRGAVLWGLSIGAPDGLRGRQLFHRGGPRC